MPCFAYVIHFAYTLCYREIKALHVRSSCMNGQCGVLLPAKFIGEPDLRAIVPCVAKTRRAPSKSLGCVQRPGKQHNSQHEHKMQISTTCSVLKCCAGCVLWLSCLVTCMANFKISIPTASTAQQALQWLHQASLTI